MAKKKKNKAEQNEIEETVIDTSEDLQENLEQTEPKRNLILGGMYYGKSYWY